MPCRETVKVTYDKKRKPVNWELQCSGTCDDGTECKPKEEVTDKKSGSTKEYCACKGGTDTEPAACHIVLYKKRKKPKGPVEDTSFGCEWNPANKCPAGQKCFPVPVGNKFRDNDPEKGLEWMEFECMCQPEDEAWPN